jgi:hypothetical protein
MLFPIRDRSDVFSCVPDKGQVRCLLLRMGLMEDHNEILDPRQGPPLSTPGPLKRPLPRRDGAPPVVPLAELVCAPP